MDKNLLQFAREHGYIPDVIWYQLYGKSPLENYEEQRNKILEKYYNKNNNEQITININTNLKK